MGLDQSRWAYPRGHIPHSRGDWNCNFCRGLNYYWRDKCEKCNNSRSVLRHYIAVPAASTTSQALATPKKQQISPHTSTVPGGSLAPGSWFLSTTSNNLQSSQWANRQVMLNPTRRYSIRPQERPLIYSNSINKKQVTGVTNNLGLPYQVQHYILSLMQRMIEEACYDFALRWIPGKLVKWGWDCAEAIELAKWRNTLPVEVPQHAFSNHPNYSLSRGLENAVKIRNVVAHRHICDNCTIRGMAWQAEQLMLIFSDNTRKEKFNDLWLEIDEWEKNSDDLDFARRKLESALQRIADRPIDEMDWTPNSIAREGISPEKKLAESNYYMDDLMDLDYF